MKIYRDLYDACNHLAPKDTKLIVDLGARLGEGYSHFGVNWPNAKYVFVEPSPKCIPTLENVIRENSKRDITLIPGILGIEESDIDFFIFDNDNDQAGNIFTDRGGAYGKTSTVKVKKFDYRNFFDKIDFVKCNIEGGEYQLINEGFFDIVDNFAMEIHNQHVKNFDYRNVLKDLSDKFDIEIWGNVNYKYCFASGKKKSR